MHYQWFKFNEMKKPIVDSMLKLRHEVFTVEEGRVGLDNDDIDHISHHLCIVAENSVVACLRLYRLQNNRSESPVYKIGRFCVSKEYRQKKIGRKMISMALLKGQSLGGDHVEFSVESQVYLASLYQSLGFQGDGDPYVDDDVPHIPMRLTQTVELDIPA